MAKDLAKPSTITSWSPSRLNKYENCPRKAKYEIIDKLCRGCFKGVMKGWNPASCATCGWKEESSEALERGSRVHREAEDYIAGRSKTHGEDLNSVKKLLGTLRSAYKKDKVRVEFELAITKDWKVCTYFAKDTWARFKLDALHWYATKKLLIIDWKTGKKKDEEYEDQMNSYNVAALAVGLADEVRAELIFTDQKGEVVPSKPVLKADLDKHKKRWEKRVLPMFNDTSFAPRPGNGCRWCGFSKNKGGPCPY